MEDMVESASSLVVLVGRGEKAEVWRPPDPGGGGVHLLNYCNFKIMYSNISKM